MATTSEIKITVVKKMDSKDVLGKSMPETSEDYTSTCNLWEEGKEFIVKRDGKMPENFCSWAWHDIHRDITTLQFGGNFPWIKEPGKGYTCCTDGLRPVVFKLERIK